MDDADDEAVPPASAPVQPSIWPQMTGEAIADYLGVSPRWLSKLAAEGFIVRGASKLFDGGEVCRGYIAWLKDDSRRSAKTETAKRKEAAQAEKYELENARLKNELVDIDTVEASVAEIFTLLRAELGAVPAAATRDLALRAEIETHLNHAFDRCGARLAAAREALASGRPVLDGDEEADA